MNRWQVLLTALFAFGGLVGCGSIKVRDVNQPELATVRKVAVASFSFRQPHASKLLGAPGGGSMAAHESDDVNATLKDINATLAKSMRWTMLPTEEMKNNAVYKKFFDAKMKGWQANKVPVEGKQFLVEGVMDSQSLFRMKPDERNELMEALKVDAIVETDVNIAFDIKGVAVMGFGPRHPQANVQLRMYKRGVEAPVWFEGRVVGESAPESVGATGYFDEHEVTRKGIISAKTAFAKLNTKKEAKE